jgi:hypothetical protein
VSYQRLSTHERNMKRIMLIHKLDHAVHKVVAPEITKAGECGASSQMVCAIGVTSRTTQRAFTRNLDG